MWCRASDVIHQVVASRQVLIVFPFVYLQWADALSVDPVLIFVITEMFVFTSSHSGCNSATAKSASSGPAWQAATRLSEGNE